MSICRHLAQAAALAAFFEALINGESTVFELHYETGLAMNTIRKLLMIMKRRKLIHIASWSQDSVGRFTLAVYKLGDKRDAKRPPRQTATQRSAARRERIRLARIHNLGAPSCTVSPSPNN